MYDESCYKRNFLKEVVVRIDFDQSVQQLMNAVPKSLMKRISSNFSILEPQDVTTSTVEFQPGAAGAAKQIEHKSVTWKYFNSTRTKSLILSHDSLTIQYFIYSSFEELEADLDAVVDEIQRQYPACQSKRFGIRYINQIEGSPFNDPLEWGEFISKDLCGTRHFFSAGSAITRFLEVAEMQRDDISLRFIYGLPNPDYPAPMRKAQFLIDIDAYVLQVQELSQSQHFVRKAHDAIQDLFERSITDEFRRVISG